MFLYPPVPRQSRFGHVYIIMSMQPYSETMLHGCLTWEAVKLGVKSVVLFPKTPDELKTQTAEEAACAKQRQGDPCIFLVAMSFDRSSDLFAAVQYSMSWVN